MSPGAELVRAVRLAAGSKPIQSVSIVLASDSLIADLHGRFMGDPSPTMSSPSTCAMSPYLEGAPIDGEVVLSVETARREARRRRPPQRQEVLRYAIHGTLHLVGYDDATPGQRRKMRLQENRVFLAGSPREIRGAFDLCG